MSPSVSMADSSQDPYNADTEEYVSDADTDTPLAPFYDDNQMSIGSVKDPRDANIFVTREELEEWETELGDRVKETRATLGQLLPICEVLKSQALKDTQTLRSLNDLLRPEETESNCDVVIIESSEDSSDEH